MAATDADARAAGFSTPVGTNLISGGDDAIRQNARTALNLIEDATFAKATTLPGGDLNDLTTPGAYPFWAGVANTPSELSGTVYVTQLLTTAGTVAQTVQLAFSGSTSGSRVDLRFSGSIGWASWQRLDAGALDPAMFASAPALSPAGFKAVPLALTAGGGGAAGPTSGTFRMPVKFAATITRWRVHFRNNNPRFGTDGPSASIPAVYAGPAASGQFTAQPAQISTGLTTGSVGTATPWQSTQIPAGTEYAIAYSFTASATNQVVGGGWSASSVNSTSATLTRVVSLPLDAWIEAEVAPETPVIAVFGDSLSAGVGATLPVHDSWLSQWCRSHAALPVHYAASGDTMAGWADTNAYKWQRWQHLTRPDAVVHAMGNNDVFGETSLADLKTRRAASILQLQALVSPVIYSATITPRNSATGAAENVRRAYNAWLKTGPDAARDVFDFVPAISGDDENISPGFNADGIHLNTSGYAAEAGTITRPLTSSSLTDLEGRIAPLAYDSGLRNVSDLARPFTTSMTGITLERVGSEVDLVWYVRRFDSAPVDTLPTTILTLPAGFRPRTTYRVPAEQPAGVSLDVFASGAVQVRTGSIPLNSFVTFRLKHSTSETPPITPPGGAA